MGKGRRERVLPLWKETAAAITAWLRARAPDGDPELFLNAAGRAMTRSGFEYILAKHVAVAAGCQLSIARKRVTPHVLRHSFASLAGDLGYSETTIAALVGHKGQSITSRYVHAADAVLLAAADAVAARTAELMGLAAPSGKVVQLVQAAQAAPERKTA